MIITSAQLRPRILAEDEFPHLTLALNITRSVDDYASATAGEDNAALTPALIMSFVQRAWYLDPERANRSPLIIATYHDPERGCLILGAFVFGRADRSTPLMPDCFVESPYPGDDGRRIFLARPAPDAVWNKYVGHYLPKPAPGDANPVRYINQ